MPDSKHLELEENPSKTSYEEIWTERVESYREIYLKKLFYQRCVDMPSLEVNNHRTWNEFARYLQPNKCQFGIFRTTYLNEPKIIFILWGPDRAPVKDKMLTASAKELFKRKCRKITLELQATDYDELMESALIEKFTGYRTKN